MVGLSLINSISQTDHYRPIQELALGQSAEKWTFSAQGGGAVFAGRGRGGGSEAGVVKM